MWKMMLFSLPNYRKYCPLILAAMANLSHHQSLFISFTGALVPRIISLSSPAQVAGQCVTEWRTTTTTTA
jgi:hypothetical protein